MEVVYAAFGKEYVYQAAISVKSLKRHMPDVRTLLVTDLGITPPWFDRTIVVPGSGGLSPKEAKTHKLTALEFATCDAVLYLDADTYVVDDLRGLENETSGWDLALAHDTWQRPEVYRTRNAGLPEFDPPPSHPYFNSGVMFVWRDGSGMALMRNWMGDFTADHRMNLDQLPLREKLYASRDVRVLTLPPTYNCRAAEPVFLSGKLKVLHRGVFAGGNSWHHSHAFLADFLNSTTANRIYSPLERKMTILNEDFSEEIVLLDEHVAQFESPEHLLV